MPTRDLLVTGATGYVGGRLVPELLDAGMEVRCLARSPAKLDDRPWTERVEVVQGDVTDAESLRRPWPASTPRTTSSTPWARPPTSRPRPRGGGDLP